jgi:hypothetical protein
MLVGAGALFCLITAYAQQGPAQKPAAAAGGTNTATATINFTAKSANVSDAGTPVKINILRWSTDAERLALVGELDPSLAPAPAARGRGGAAGGGSAPAAAAGRGAGAGSGSAAAGRGARGGAGGRGGRGGGNAAPAKPADPISNLTAAIEKAPTVGYIWTDEVVGYSLKYAYKIPFSDGGERVILVTDRRLGGYTNSWKPTGKAAPTNYDFTVVELRFDAKGVGEGKTSLTTKVVTDEAAKSLVLEDYTDTPVMLAGVKK